MDFYRTDDRDPFKIQSSNGFGLKAAKAISAIRLWLKTSYGNGTVQSQLSLQFASGQEWAISFTSNKDLGGLEKKFCYKVSIPSLQKYEVNLASVGVQPNATDAAKTKLWMDAATIDNATIIALWSSQPGRSVEYSFVTPIPLINVTMYSKLEGSFKTFKEFHGREEYLTLDGGSVAVTNPTKPQELELVSVPLKIVSPTPAITNPTDVKKIEKAKQLLAQASSPTTNTATLPKSPVLKPHTFTKTTPAPQVATTSTSAATSSAPKPVGKNISELLKKFQQ